LSYPYFAIISGVGLWHVLCLLKTAKWRLFGYAVIAGVILFELTAYSHYYFAHYADRTQSEWQIGYKEMIQKLESVRENYENVIVTREQGRPSMYYFFYTKQNPSDVQREDIFAKKDQQEFLTYKNIRFTDGFGLDTKTLYVTSPKKVDEHAHIVDTVKTKNDETVWVFWEYTE